MCYCKALKNFTKNQEKRFTLRLSSFRNHEVRSRKLYDSVSMSCARKDEWIRGEHTEAQHHSLCLLTKVGYLNGYLHASSKSKMKNCISAFHTNLPIICLCWSNKKASQTDMHTLKFFLLMYISYSLFKKSR